MAGSRRHTPGSRRRRWRHAADALAAGCLSLAIGAQAAAASEAIRVGFISTSLASIPIIVADAKGYFRDEGLDATLVGFESSNSIALAVASGDIDFGTTGLSNPFFVLANSGTLKIIGGDTTEHAGFHGLGFVASNQAYAAGMKSTADFAGHSFGVTQVGSPLEYSLALVLEKHGIALKDVRVIGLQSNSNVASAITGGQIDGAIMSSANLNAVVDRGGGKFMSWLDEEVHGAAVSGTVASTKIANGRPDAVRHFLAAFRKGAQTWDAAFLDAKGNRANQPQADQMIALMAKGLHQPTKVIVDGLNYVDPQARIDLGDIQRMLDWYEAMGMQKTHIDAKSIIDMRYAKLMDAPSAK
jgi:NitT/TauT family transport system substrate-binding protein